jgi:hypothetical protein
MTSMPKYAAIYQVRTFLGLMFDVQEFERGISDCEVVRATKMLRSFYLRLVGTTGITAPDTSPSIFTIALWVKHGLSAASFDLPRFRDFCVVLST